MMDQELARWMQKIDDQLNRLVSDAESEKGLRKERTREIDARSVRQEERIYKLERWQSQWGGALIALTVLSLILSVIIAVIKLK